jgi:hypothetical protein
MRSVNMATMRLRDNSCKTRRRVLTPQVDKIEEQALNLGDLAGPRRGICDGLDSSNTMKQDAPLTRADQAKRDDDVEFLVPDGNRPIQMIRKVADGEWQGSHLNMRLGCKTSEIR